MIRFKVKFKDGRILMDEKNKNLRDYFYSTIKNDSEVFIYMEANSPDGTASQIKFIHACIGEISKESGALFAETKKQLKEECGLIINGFETSFKDCSKNELSNVINTLISWGKHLNIDFTDRFLD